jgi:hypothetical protein
MRTPYEPERGPPMDDPEREHFLRRLDEMDRARRRWKVLALAGTPALALLLMIALAAAVTSGLALREKAERIQVESESALREAEDARMETTRALRVAEEARMRAERAFSELPPAEKEP